MNQPNPIITERLLSIIVDTNAIMLMLFSTKLKASDTIAIPNPNRTNSKLFINTNINANVDSSMINVSFIQPKILVIFSLQFLRLPLFLSLDL